MDVVDLKSSVKEHKIYFYLEDNYIYCKNNITKEISIVGSYSCINAKINGIEFINEKHEKINIFPKENELIYISNKIDLNILLSFGFKLRKTDGHYVKKVYLNNSDDDKNFYDIDPKTRIVNLTRLDGLLDDTIVQLVKAGFIE